MNRIAFMVIRNIFRLPVWFYRLNKMGRLEDTHTEQERYDFLKGIIKKVNRSGRVCVQEYGVENIPKDNGFILFPNHQGLFDMLALVDTCPNHLAVVIKKEAANWILVKQIIRMLRGLVMDREDIKASFELIKKVTAEVQQGRNYVIFAEGTRSKNENQILHFKGGTFKSAVNAKCPIIPVALINSFRPFDISSIKKEVVQVHYLPPITYDQYVGKKTVEIADIVERIIQEEINKNI